MNYVAIICLGVWALSWVAVLSGTCLVFRHFRTRHFKRPWDPFLEDEEPPVSILKPIKGIDSGLETNLDGFFHLDYPNYELIFSIANADDPARSLVINMIKQYPDVQARLIIGDVPLGPNPKVNNLKRSYDEASHDWILISDSNIRVSSDYLKTLMVHATPRLGILTAVVAGTNPRGLGGHLEAAYLNTFYARWMIMTAKLGFACVVGKSMLFRRSVAKRFGGLKALAPYLAEDYMAGEAMKKLGYEVKILEQPARQFIGRYSFLDFWRRHVRWGRIRKSQAPIAFFLEPWFGCLGSAVFGLYGIQQLSISISTAQFLAAHLLFWGLNDLLLIRRVSGTITWMSLPSWFLRELLSVPHAFITSLGWTVYWRGQTFRLQPGGILQSDTKVIESFRTALTA